MGIHRTRDLECLGKMSCQTLRYNFALQSQNLMFICIFTSTPQPSLVQSLVEYTGFFGATPEETPTADPQMVWRSIYPPL